MRRRLPAFSAAPSFRLSQRLVVPVVCVSVTFVAIVDGAITTVALPSIGRQFGLSITELDGVVVVYPVCLAMAIPASAWLVERFGGKRVLLTALAGFLGSSLLCGAALGIGQLVAYRALQGLSAGVLFPASTALLFGTFTSAEQIRVSRYMIVPQQIAPAAAPVLGGLLVDDLSWRWVFYVNLPVGLPALLFGALFLADGRGSRPGRFDLPGLLLSAGGLSTVMFGVCEGPHRGWSSPAILTALASGAVLLTAAVAVELRTDQPALRLRLFADRLFRDTNVINLVGLIPVMGTLYLGPLFLQQAQGRTALESGLTTFPEAFGVLLTVQLSGALYVRVGPRVIVGCGLTGVGAVLLLFAGCDTGTGLWTFRALMSLFGAAIGCFFIPTTVASLATVERADLPQATMLNTVVRQTGGALAPAVVTTALVLGTPPGAGAVPPLAAYQHSYLALAAIAAATAVFAFTLPDGPARAAARGAAGHATGTSGRPAPLRQRRGRVGS
ncbi:DHA2 family efflux MFS transporter permease subunit [Streptomyces sp. SID8381]|uniref:DHA2 family efflux MFS transporter permease subunit n=1 Tax=unclassified Streptomyces TaxID=2593676 RepID=UPI0004841190|nr:MULTISPECIES: DHA2 family efflux MFS transporter permease subunit [unclassified Streptomyces]MYX25093.1 DHA2 family efflux MFS transporter permease subunit [Streptomyces sp. SID8381]